MVASQGFQFASGLKLLKMVNINILLIRMTSGMADGFVGMIIYASYIFPHHALKPHLSPTYHLKFHI